MIETLVILLLLLPVGVTIVDSKNDKNEDQVSYVDEIRIPIDRDGNEYQYKKIGDLYWFTEDLKTFKYDTGIEIPVLHDTLWSKVEEGAIAGNTEAPINHYNFYVTSNEICPYGWRVPTTEDWENLKSSLGGSDVAGGLLKGFDYWNFPNEGATNQSGWNALPFGFIDDRGIPSGIGMSSGWWSIDPSDSNKFQTYIVHFTTDDLLVQEVSPNIGACIRCVTNVVND